MVENMKKIVIALGMMLLVFGSFSSLNGQQIETASQVGMFKEYRTGRFEVSVHFGSWSLNPLQKMFEEELIDSIGDEVRDEVRKQAKALQPGLVEGGFDHSLALDSSGTNFGLEIRYYPKGRWGAISFGLSLEKTNMRMAIGGPLRQEFDNGAYAEVEAEGYIDLSPVTTNLSVRWDFAPRWLVSPYLVFGLGVAALNGDVGYSYDGSLEWAGPSETLTDSDVKTFKEMEEDIDFNIPNIFVLVQMNLGLRAVIMKHLTLNLEAGFWDGIVIRGGLGARF